MGVSPIEQERYGQSPLTQANAPGPTLLGLLSLLPPQYRWTLKQFFAYTCNFLPLTASSTQTQQIGIQSDADFIITYALAIVTDTTNLIKLPFVPQLVTLQDSAAGLNLFSAAVHADAVFGDASNPGIFAVPYVMQRTATLSVQLQNLEATDRNVRISFCGFKSYPGTDVRNPRWQSNDPR